MDAITHSMSRSAPSETIHSPAAWIGPEQAAHREWVHVLSADELRELTGAVSRAKALGKPLGAIVRDDVPLEALGRTLADWGRALDDGRGFVLVKGVPVQELSEADVELAYWILGLHLGSPVPQNKKGDLLGHVRDEGDDPTKIGTRLYRTRAAQDFHTDGADIIGLLCLKPSKAGGISRIVSSVTVFNEVLKRRPDLVPLLFEEFYWDREADADPGEPPVFKFPICKYENGRLRTFYIGWYIRNAQRFEVVPRLTPQQTELLDLIEAVANDPAFHLDMDFEPGDIQFLKNAAILHARTAYEDWEDPTLKRHLLRLWLAAPDFKDGDEALRKGVTPQADSAAP